MTSSRTVVAGKFFRSSSGIPHITFFKFLKALMVKFGFFKLGVPILLVTRLYSSGHYENEIKIMKDGYILK